MNNENQTETTNFALQKAAWIVLGLLLAGSGSTRAEGDGTTPAGADAQQTAYRSSLAQESVREQSSDIRNDLLQSIAELKLNDLGAGDVAALTEAANHMAGLSQEEMQKIVTTLQNASAEREEGKRQTSLAGAYQGQKDVALKLKTLAAELSAEEAQNELPARLQLLIARQSANIRKTTALSSVGATPQQLDPSQTTVHTVASAEQTAIGGEVDVLYKAVSSTATGPATDPATPIAKTAADAMAGSMLQTVVPLASQFTQAGPFADAVTKQTAVRDYLLGVMVALVSQEDMETRLYQLRSQLDEAQDDEKDLAHTAAQSILAGATLAERQSRIGDLADITEALLKPLNQAAATRMADARKDMDLSAAALQSAKDPKSTAPQQQQAIQTLADVAKLLDQQIASLENQESESPLDQTTDLQNLITELNQIQQTDKTDAASAEKELNQIQQNNPGDLTPDVASDISRAADKLAPKQPDADGANKDLSDATTALQKQIDDLAKSAQDYKALQDFDQKLADAEKSATDADNKLPAADAGKMADIAKGLTDADDKVDQANGNAPADVPADAKQDLKAAGDALKDATTNAVQSKGAPADASAQKGIAAIRQARESVGQAMAAMEGKGQSSGHGMASTQGNGSLHPGRGISGQKLGGGATANGGPAQVIGALQPKDRDALKQYESEKVAPDYAPQVEQYLKNLGDYKGTP